MIILPRTVFRLLQLPPLTGRDMRYTGTLSNFILHVQPSAAIYMIAKPLNNEFRQTHNLKTFYWLQYAKINRNAK